MHLPDTIRQRIEELYENDDRPSLVSESKELSAQYRQCGKASSTSTYELWRMPATYAAIRYVLAQMRLCLPQYVPTDMSDVGAGTGSGYLAAREDFPQIEAILCEPSPQMRAIGMSLLDGAAQWSELDILSPTTVPRASLVLCSYMLGELPPSSLCKAVGKLWDAAEDTLILIEPGTMRGYATIREAIRALAGKANIAAPCPGISSCPLGEGEWCHFSVRLFRSALHRAAKSAVLGYEDEKFSYVILTRQQPFCPRARILRHPMYAKGRVTLSLCTCGSAISQTYTKSHAQYKAARDARWGDCWQP